MIVAVLTVLMVEAQASLPSLVAVKAEPLYFASVATSQMVKLVAGIGLVIAGLGVWGLVVGLAAASLSQLILATGLSLRRMGLRRFNTSSLAGVLRVGLANYPLMVSTGLVSSVSVLLAALATGSPGDTGLFYISLMVAVALGFIPMGVASAALPRMVERGDASVLGGPARVALGLVAPLAAGIFVAPSLVLGLIGPAYRVGGDVLRVLALSVIPVSALQLATSRLNAAGRFRRILGAGVVRLGLLVALAAFLVPRLGLEGLGWSYTISSVAGLAVMMDAGILGAAAHAFSLQAAGVLAGFLASGLAGSRFLGLLVAVVFGYAAGHLTGLIRLGEVVGVMHLAFKGAGLGGFRSQLPSWEAVSRGLVIAFIVTLGMAAAVLALGDEESANRLAEYAYYLLVAGVAAALVDTARGDGEGEG